MLEIFNVGRSRVEQFEFFAGGLRDLIPDEHVLARVARVLDLTWLRDEIADLYCSDNGRPGIEPVAALRLMLAGFVLGFVHDRRLMVRRRSTSRPVDFAASA